MEKDKDKKIASSDSEDEVFFTKASCPPTSTPLEKIQYGKRKRSSSNLRRRTRHRPSMSHNKEEEFYEMDEDEEEIADLGAFMKQMSRDMAKINSNVTNIQANIRTSVAEAIEPITARLDANCRRMDRLELNQRNDIEDLRLRLDEAIKKKKSSRPSPTCLLYTSDAADE